MNQKNIIVTTPIYYVNSSPHIGHAYTNLIASCLTKWLRLDSNNVMLLTGTDEHGQKIEESAKKSGQNIQDFIDFYSSEFRNLADVLELPYDDFIRTSEERHKKIVSKIWTKLYEKDLIYLSKYSGWYSVRDEAFYKESEISNGKAPNGSEVSWREEEAYFFRLSKFEDRLLDFFENNIDFIKPVSRRNEVISFVKSGLEDLCVSRKNFSHGIPVPGEKEHTIYVWIDALANYISALGFGEDGLKSEKFFNFWPQKDLGSNEAFQIIGKDILRFHAVYWPAMLFALEIEPPTSLIVHGWWLNDGEKISKSLGNIIDPFELINKFGRDYVSYFFLSEIGFDSDGDYGEEKFKTKINSDLVNNVGNLISRLTNMSEIYFDGDVDFNQNNDLYNLHYKEKIQNFWSKFSHLMSDFKFNRAILEILSFSSEINILLDQNKPWKIFGNKEKLISEDERKRMNDLFFVCLKAICFILFGLYSFIPQKAKQALCSLFHLELKNLSEKNIHEEVFKNKNFQKILKINIFNRL